MQNHLRMGVAAVLTMIALGGVRTASAWEQSRLTALAARQNLHAKVCIAMSDDRISPAERYAILSDARRVLEPDEYEAFKQGIYRLSPPQPALARHSTNAARQQSSAATVFVTDAKIRDRMAFWLGLR